MILIHYFKKYGSIVPRMYGHWNIVWKAIVHSRTYDYTDTYTCKIDHGIGIVLKQIKTD